MISCETRLLSSSLLVTAILLVCSLGAPASQGQYLVEDPNSLAPGQQWYLIEFDVTGACTRKQGWGYGTGWYYYPRTKTYRQWYYRGLSDTTRDACLTISAAIVSLDETNLATAQMNVIWTTAAWSALKTGRPPLPSDVASATTDAQYVGSDVFQSLPPAFFGTVEPVKDYTISGYSPEWVGLEVSGKNVKMFRWIAPKCDTNPDALGACCNALTGDCFLSKARDCRSPSTWRGADTTCDTCAGSAGGTLDYGDAPDSYDTLLKSGGPRHIISPGVFLGRSVDGEADGQPTPAATGDDVNGVNDDDGVVFTGPLVPGETVMLDVTASTPGYLNAWVDFDRDGTFTAAGDQVFKDMPLLGGMNHLSLTVPATAKFGDTFARFRFSRRGLLSWKGLAEDGEVEDYKVSLTGAYTPQASVNRGAAKWVQSPQAATSTPFVFPGWGAQSDLYLGQALADDWQCQDTRPVTGFQWWGTFAGWQETHMPSQAPTAFQLSIWTNSPAGSGQNSFAHPNLLVWQATCTNWVWTVAGQADDPRNTNGNETCFEFTCLLPQDQWFHQDPGARTNTYWLSIAAVYDTAAPVAQPWGWLTVPTSAGSGAVNITALASSAGTTLWPPRLESVWSAGVQIKDNQSAVQNLAFNVLTNDGQTASDLNLAPVYRFWSASWRTHFYTISEEEKDKLIDLFPDIWFFEGVAFYAYPPGDQPVSAKPIYRFRSIDDGHHFYTASESEKNKLIKSVPNAWIYEGIVWYAYDQM